jgi:hypothetical protein
MDKRIDLEWVVEVPVSETNLQIGSEILQLREELCSF